MGKWQRLFILSFSEKYPLIALFLAAFLTFQSYQAVLNTFVSKTEKIRKCLIFFFQKYTALMAVFFSHVKTPFFHVLIWTTNFEKRDFFLTLLSSVFAKNSIDTRFYIFFCIAMALWKRFLPFFLRLKLPAHVPF